jgi:UDP-glucose 4-epimerase
VRAVVTGGAGFIGSHLVDALLDAGDEVTVVDHLNPARAPVFEALRARGARLVRGDVTDVAAMHEAFAGARPEAVYHLAAQIDVRRSVEDPSTDAHTNIGGTAAVLEAARHCGARRVVLASTAGVYGEPQALPISETAPVAPLSPYGLGKAAAETYLALFQRLYGLSTLSLRMANVYGPRQNPHGEAGVVAIFCAAAAERRPVTIFGDGTQTRDFVYVGDVVQAFVRAGRCEAGGAINVSTGSETSLLTLASTLELARTHGEGRLGEILRSSLDPSLAAERLGWRAQTPLSEGLARTLAHVTSRSRPVLTS